jgi:hypothetical protein
MSPEQAAKFEAELRGWAETHYPAITSAKRLPDSLLLGFLVGPTGAVVEHSVGFKSPEGGNVSAELVRLFPKYSEAALRVNGAACFGGVRAGEPRYCVVFARVNRS